MDKKRKEVVLDQETLSLLEFKAKKEGRNLKNYMEHILKENAYAFEPLEEYKIMMDKMIKNHNEEKINYTPWSAIKKDLLK
ncbi:hypothetical protein [uncultured Polaribacter sp.]|uniref:hypothetical protein n=1 Tax=uncultured Polaribacter sp. TaxID=174711 RepID=UPI002632A6CD|nr:hypothetical protein [uncultured Polaribacter sp.]